MKKLSAIFFAFLFTLTCSSQTVFQKAFGDSLDEYAFSCIQTADKGYLLAGFSNSYAGTDNDYFLVKTDSLAHIQWNKRFRGLLRDEAYSVKQTSGGGFIIAGYTNSFGSQYYDALLIKTDANGDTLWSKTYGAAGSEYANSIIQTKDGGYIFAGYTIGNAIDTAYGSAFLVKTDSSGNRQWERALGPSSQYTDAYSILQTPDAGYVVTGYTNGFGEINGDVFFVKTDSSGNPLFSKTYGYKGSDWGNSIKQTTDGGFIIGGSYGADSTGTDEDAYIIKTDMNGDTVWTRRFGGPGFDYGQSVIQSSDGGYVLAGYTSGFGNGQYDMFIVKYNSSGDTVFARTFGSFGNDEANCIFQSADGGYVLAGQSNSFGSGNYDMYFIKTDASGNSSCFQTDVHAAINNPVCFVNNVLMKADTVTTAQFSVIPFISGNTSQLDACTTVDVRDGTIEEEFKIYPNPNSGKFMLSTEKTTGMLTVISLLGEKIYEANVTGFTIVEIPNIMPGVYIVQFYSSGRIHNRKILVNK